MIRATRGGLKILVASAWIGLSGCGKTERDPLPSNDVEAQGPRQLPGTDASASDGGASALADSTEVWVGEVYPQATYPDPFSDTAEGVVLILSTTEAGLGGTITFGQAPVPEVDPDAFYPPGIDHLNLMNNPLSGFQYSLVAVRVEGDGLQLTFAPGELWKDWCAGRPSYPAGPNTFNDEAFVCSPDEPRTSHSDYLYSPVSLCLDDSHVCSCDEASCWANSHLLRQVDLVLRGDELEGQLLRATVGAWHGEPQTVRLERVE
ncbi:MAG TPA: hypothetical protein VM686_38040 [Polyangiaceae bacterium]|nr:hypothetical protein [Polyangiaceae bacterium]